MRYLTAGESHGPALVGIIEGLPSGLFLDREFINEQLARRQGGYGRGGRMSIERDRVKFLSGLRFGKTLGTPLALQIENKDWVNWQKVMSPDPEDETKDRKLSAPRPGHADLAGGIKYLHSDLRNVLERASARETAMRVAIGAVASLLLGHFQIKIGAFVTEIGGVAADPPDPADNVNTIKKKISASPLYCVDRKAEELMLSKIKEAAEKGDTLGGIFEVRVEGLPPGLGSHVHPDRRLDGRLAAALMSIPAIKGVEIGLGFKAAAVPGSQVHDPIILSRERGICRPTNNAGGLEGGITNGETLLIRAAMKPIPTLINALPSVDLATGKPVCASVERSDICAVPAASVAGEAVVAWEVALAFMDKFGGDSLREMELNYKNYQRLVNEYLAAAKLEAGGKENVKN
ncbi:MAG: chorismate synthase [Dethiobacteria bacterium]|jgi:chorismate synthase